MTIRGINLLTEHFVSSRKMIEGDLAHNMSVLNEGTLHVAQFNGTDAAGRE